MQNHSYKKTTTPEKATFLKSCDGIFCGNSKLNEPHPGFVVFNKLLHAAAKSTKTLGNNHDG